MPWTTPETFTAGQTLTAASMNVISGNLTNLQSGRLLARVTMTDATKSTTGTTFATGTEIFASDLTFTATAGLNYIVEFYAMAVEAPATATRYTSLALSNGSGTELGRIAYVGYSNGTAILQPVFASVRYTASTTGTQTLNVVFWSSAAGTSFVYGGAAGAAANYPATLSVWGPVDA